MICRVDDLREPPVVGRYYLVPTVHYKLRRTTLDWPVIGPRHTDQEIIGFHPPHYHIDVRFLAPLFVRRLEREGGYWASRYSDEDTPPIYWVAAGLPLSDVRRCGSDSHPPVVYRRRKCHRPGMYPEMLTTLDNDGWPQRLRDHYAAASMVDTPAGPVMRKARALVMGGETVMPPDVMARATIMDRRAGTWFIRRQGQEIARIMTWEQLPEDIPVAAQEDPAFAAWAEARVIQADLMAEPLYQLCTGTMMGGAKAYRAWLAKMVDGSMISVTETARPAPPPLPPVASLEGAGIRRDAHS